MIELPLGRYHGIIQPDSKVFNLKMEQKEKVNGKSKMFAKDIKMSVCALQFDVPENTSPQVQHGAYNKYYYL